MNTSFGWPTKVGKLPHRSGCGVHESNGPQNLGHEHEQCRPTWNLSLSDLGILKISKFYSYAAGLLVLYLVWLKTLLARTARNTRRLYPHRPNVVMPARFICGESAVGRHGAGWLFRFSCCRHRLFASLLADVIRPSAVLLKQAVCLCLPPSQKCAISSAFPPLASWCCCLRVSRSCGVCLF